MFLFNPVWTRPPEPLLSSPNLFIYWLFIYFVSVFIMSQLIYNYIFFYLWYFNKNEKNNIPSVYFYLHY